MSGWLLLAASLFSAFESPPDAARPWCYWYWVNGNVDRKTITADLEAMRSVGFGGVLLLDPRGYDTKVAQPPVRYAFGSPEWRKMVVHGARECERLGLEFTMNLSDCGGSLRGPWPTGSDAPKQLVVGVDDDEVPSSYEGYREILSTNVQVAADARIVRGWRNAGGSVSRWGRRPRTGDDSPCEIRRTGAPGPPAVRLLHHSRADQRCRCDRCGGGRASLPADDG